MPDCLPVSGYHAVPCPIHGYHAGPSTGSNNGVEVCSKVIDLQLTGLLLFAKAETTAQKKMSSCVC